MSSLESSANARGEAARSSLARTITATDIAGDPALRGLWLPGHAAPTDGALAALPAGGVASPLGYWLVTHEGLVPPAGNALTMVVTAPGVAPPEFVVTPEVSPRAGRGARAQTITIKQPGDGDGDLVLKIGPTLAHVSATGSTWEALREALTLAVCQTWRFQAVDAALDELTRAAYDNLRYANAPGLAGLTHSRRLMDLGLKTRASIVDITLFQQPLTDPLSYLPSARAARAFRRLTERLGLNEWSDSIDQRAEVVEGVFETITEGLTHLRSHARDVLLGAIIVCILVIDIVLRIWEASS